MNSLTLEQVSDLNLRIGAHGLFEGLQVEQVIEIESIGIYMEYKQELVTADGDNQGYLFYVLQGDFEVSKINPDTKKNIVLAHIGPGQCFGEMSFLTGAPASANVMALERVICWAAPHETLREYIHTCEGGASIAISIASLLAHRVQEGNTRLMGMNSSLSAYFGSRARLAARQSIESPLSNEAAEMEFPEELFQSFARETLGLAPGAPLTAEQEDNVRQRIESNEIDIVPWLEQGQKGRPISVRLKFVEHKETLRGDIHRETTELRSYDSKIIRVPQTRARITPTVAYVPVPQHPLWKAASIVSYVLIFFLTISALFTMTSLESREAVTQSSSFKSLPFQSAFKLLLFREQNQNNAIALDNNASYDGQVSIPKPVRIGVTLDLVKELPADVTIKIQLLLDAAKTDQAIVDQKVRLTAGEKHFELISTHLNPGNYKLSFYCPEAPTSGAVSGNLKVSCIY